MEGGVREEGRSGEGGKWIRSDDDDADKYDDYDEGSNDWCIHGIFLGVIQGTGGREGEGGRKEGD